MTKLNSKITKTQTKIEIKTEIQIINKCCNSIELIQWYKQPLFTFIICKKVSLIKKKEKKRSVIKDMVSEQ